MNTNTVREKPGGAFYNWGMRQDWIADRLDEIGKTSAALAEEIGLPAPRVSDIIRGKRQVKLTEVHALASALEISVLEAVERLAGNPVPTDELTDIGPDEICFNGDEYAAIRRYEMRAAAGSGAEAPAEPKVLHRMLFRKEWLRRVTSAPLSQIAAIDVDGRSMEPTLHHGDTVLVDMTQRDPRKHDDIYVINADGDLQIKRIQTNPVTGLFTIISDNPTFRDYDDIAPDDVDIAGRVIWVGRQQ